MYISHFTKIKYYGEQKCVNMKLNVFYIKIREIASKKQLEKQLKTKND